jgi:hypothetical protein
LTGRGGADLGEIEAVGEEKGGAQVNRAQLRREERGESTAEGAERDREVRSEFSFLQREDQKFILNKTKRRSDREISLKRKVVGSSWSSTVKTR